jgi:predicted nucleotidyltransferase
MDRFESAAAEVASAIAGITSIYLFGSFAEHREHAESDIDFGVLVDRAVYRDDRACFDCRLLLITRLGNALHREADVVMLNDAPPLLARKIVTRGRRIFCADPVADDHFVRRIIDLADDIEPWMQEMWAIKLEALRKR